MDISTVTDINALKVMAYDTSVLRDKADNDLRLINQRIQQLLAAPNESDRKRETKQEMI